VADYSELIQERPIAEQSVSRLAAPTMLDTEELIFNPLIENHSLSPLAVPTTTLNTEELSLSPLIADHSLSWLDEIHEILTIIRATPHIPATVAYLAQERSERTRANWDRDDDRRRRRIGDSRDRDGRRRRGSDRDRDRRGTDRG
jgi:hypothetical protein